MYLSEQKRDRRYEAVRRVMDQEGMALSSKFWRGLISGRELPLGYSVQLSSAPG
jgi:hypothetical protein